MRSCWARWLERPEAGSPAKRGAGRAAKAVALAGCLAGLALGQPGAPIHGRVLDGDSDEPVASASVRLLRWPDREEIAEAETDREGRFAFGDVPRGRYLLEAAKTGYFDPLPQAARGRIIAVPGAGEEAIELALVRTAVITGKVFDAAGRPVRGLQVLAVVRRAYPGGIRLTPQGARTLTDDQGAYRLWGLPPGIYTVLLARPLQETASGAFVPVYYPGVAAPKQAQFFRLRPGETRSGADFWLPPEDAPAEVKGSVTGIPAEWAGRSVQVYLASREGVPAAIQAVVAGADGRFAFPRVAPGSYEVVALGPVAGRGPFGPLTGAGARQGRREVEVGAGAVELEVALAEPVVVAGRAVLDRAAEGAAACHAGAEVRLEPEGFAPQVRAPAARISAEGRFEIRGVFPGRYRLAVLGLKSGCFLNEIRTAGPGVAMEGGALVVAGAAAPQVTLVLTARGATVDGRVISPEGKPVAGAMVLVVRHGSFAEAAESRAAVADAEGRYKLEGIPPGRYRVLALRKVASEEYLDPLFWQEEAGGFDITLEAGSVTTADLRLKR